MSPLTRIMHASSLIFILLCMKLWMVESATSGLLEDAEKSDVSAVRLRLEEEKEKRILLNNDVEVLMLKVARLERQMTQVLQNNKEGNVTITASGGLTSANRSQCPSNYTLHTPLHLCFRLSDEKQTIDTARHICESEGGHLAKVNSTDIWQYLKEQIRNSRYIPKVSFVSIGGNDKDEEGVWRWHDRELIDMKRPLWGLGQPNGGASQKCLMMDGHENYHFNDIECSSLDYYICQV